MSSNDGGAVPRPLGGPSDRDDGSASSAATSAGPFGLPRVGQDPDSLSLEIIWFDLETHLAMKPVRPSIDAAEAILHKVNGIECDHASVTLVDPISSVELLNITVRGGGAGHVFVAATDAQGEICSMANLRTTHQDDRREYTDCGVIVDAPSNYAMEPDPAVEGVLASMIKRECAAGPAWRWERRIP